MKKTKRKNVYYFVDEAGDPAFYNKRSEFIVGREGCSKILMLGFVETEEPKVIRNELQKLKDKIKSDSYLKDVPSLKKSLKYFHATDDCPEVRQEVYKSIGALNFKAQFVVARKIEGVFRKYDCNENKFYDALVAKLFKNVLHRSENNFIYFAKRGSKNRQEPLEKAIEHAKDSFERKFLIKIRSNTFIQSQVPTGEPCLQVIDYMNWAIYRVFVKREMRYYNFVNQAGTPHLSRRGCEPYPARSAGQAKPEGSKSATPVKAWVSTDKVSFVWDIYDTTYPKNFYSKSNELDIKKISLL